MAINAEAFKKAIENSQQILDTLNQLVEDDKPYKKQLLLLTKNYPKYELDAEDIAEVISNLIDGNTASLDNFSYDPDDKCFLLIYDKNEDEIVVFELFAGKGIIETTYEFLICYVITQLEHLATDFPESVKFK